ncbi:hypothetical protein JZ751_001008 [Albula glossodonta]|uniref:Uncharacterized protein n=1 Tax=Albula glossodonta TaxID=121402 RepID=A0A8T2PXX6_9TELE|nr:hypothetical protein JZ751_001008 [Albula glossodonta]
MATVHKTPTVKWAFSGLDRPPLPHKNLFPTDLAAHLTPTPLAHPPNLSPVCRLLAHVFSSYWAFPSDNTLHITNMAKSAIAATVSADPGQKGESVLGGTDLLGPKISRDQAAAPEHSWRGSPGWINGVYEPHHAAGRTELKHG